MGCHSDWKQNSTSKTEDQWKGQYTITVKTDSTAIDFKMQLITADDGKVYGFIESDFKSYEAPIALDSITSDSIFFHTYTNNLALSKRDSVRQGRFDFLRKRYKANLTKTSSDVWQSLKNSKSFTPIQLDIEAKGMAWATPTSPTQMYLMNDRQIYFAELVDGTWQTNPVDYDKNIWEFYSIGISADQKRLIAHGKPLVDSLPHQGGGDYYFLDLETPTKVGKISALPNSINTDSYDIFPWMTIQGDILLTTYGELENMEKSGRGDIYFAKLQEDGTYGVEEFDEKINTDESEAGVFMDYDNRFIIFHKNNRKKNLKDRLFISRKLASGWSEPEMIGPPVNRDFTWTYAGRIDPQGKYFYFNSGFRGQTEIYRVATKDVPQLKEFFN